MIGHQAERSTLLVGGEPTAFRSRSRDLRWNVSRSLKANMTPWQNNKASYWQCANVMLPFPLHAFNHVNLRWFLVLFYAVIWSPNK